MDSPRTGAPSIISYLAIVSFSVYWFGAVRKKRESVELKRMDRLKASHYRFMFS